VFGRAHIVRVDDDIGRARGRRQQRRPQDIIGLMPVCGAHNDMAGAPAIGLIPYTRH
jgi:hypothetical protein